MNDGWSKRSFGEIARWASGKALSSNERHDNGRYPVMGANGEIARTDRVLCSAPVVTVGRVGACGEVHRTEGPAWVTDNALIAAPIDDSVLLEFLALQLEAFDFDLIKGGTNQSLITQTSLKAQEVPVAPLDEQRRIVDLMEAVDDVIRATCSSSRLAQTLLIAATESLTNSAELRPLRELVRRVRRPVAVEPTSEYRQIGIRSHGRGMFHKDPVRGDDLGSKGVFWIKPGDLVFNIVFAWEGAVAVASMEEDSMCGSHRFPTYCATEIGSVEFLRHFFRSSTGRALLEVTSPGSAGRNRTLNQEMLLDASVPAPSLMEQQGVATFLEAIEAQAAATLTMLETLHEVRAAMLRSLLSGEHEIPGSYDELMGRPA